MSTTLRNLKLPYPNEGVIRTAQLNDTVCPENSVQLGMNMNFDQIGAIKTRGGLELATTASGSITSFGTYHTQTAYRLFAQVGTDISAWNGTTWTSVRTLTTPTYKARFSQFLGRTWMVNGTNGDAVKTSGGSTFDTTYVPQSPLVFPKGDFISAGFEGRVWVADSANDVIYFTDIVQFAPPSTYSLAYPETTAGSGIPANFIKNFSPQDGQSITGLCRVPRALLVFKQDAIYRVYGAYSVDPYPAYNVGTYSQESIIKAKDGIYFHHSSGFYKFTYDSQPTEISRRVIDFVKAIPRSYYSNICGIWDGFDAVLWSVGPVTVEGVTYSNCVLRYTISTQVWTIYNYDGNTITAMVRLDDNTTIHSLVGTSTGKVGKIDSGTTDFGAPIYYEMIDRWRSYTEMYSKSKSISGIMVSSQNGGGAELMYQTEKSPANVWEYIDTIKDEYDALFPNANTKDGNVFRFRLKGRTSGEPMIFHGIELLSVQDKGLDIN